MYIAPAALLPLSLEISSFKSPFFFSNQSQTGAPPKAAGARERGGPGPGGGGDVRKRKSSTVSIPSPRQDRRNEGQGTRRRDDAMAPFRGPPIEGVRPAPSLPRHDVAPANRIRTLGVHPPIGLGVVDRPVQAVVSDHGGRLDLPPLGRDVAGAALPRPPRLHDRVGLPPPLAPPALGGGIVVRGGRRRRRG